MKKLSVVFTLHRCVFFFSYVFFFFSLFYSSIKNNHMIMAKNDNSNKYVNNDCTVYATFI